MPERQIQVTEYKCKRCYYQWISRTLTDKYKDKKKDKPEKKDHLGTSGFFYNANHDYHGNSKGHSFHSRRYFNYPRDWSDEMYVNYKPRHCPKCKSNLWDEEYFGPLEKILRVRLVPRFNDGIGKKYDQYGVTDEEGRLTYVTRCFLNKIRPTEEELYRVIGREQYVYDWKTKKYPDGPFGDNDVKWEDGDDAIEKRRQEIMVEILKDHGVIITPEEIAEVKEEQRKYDEVAKWDDNWTREYYKRQAEEKQATENYYKNLVSSTSKTKVVGGKISSKQEVKETVK